VSAVAATLEHCHNRCCASVAAAPEEPPPEDPPADPGATAGGTGAAGATGAIGVTGAAGVTGASGATGAGGGAGAPADLDLDAIWAGAAMPKARLAQSAAVMASFIHRKTGVPREVHGAGSYTDSARKHAL
jgi:hypothetical protein